MLLVATSYGPHHDLVDVLREFEPRRFHFALEHSADPLELFRREFPYLADSGFYGTRTGTPKDLLDRFQLCFSTRYCVHQDIGLLVLIGFS
jgi:hypothetical protein